MPGQAARIDNFELVSPSWSNGKAKICSAMRFGPELLHYCLRTRPARVASRPVEAENPLSRRPKSSFKITIQDSTPFRNGDVVTLDGTAAALNDGTATTVVMERPLSYSSPECASMSELVVNQIRVSACGLVIDCFAEEGNWDSIIVEHRVWVSMVIYVDIGNTVLSSTVGIRPGEVFNLAGTILEFCEVGNMWAVHLNGLSLDTDNLSGTKVMSIIGRHHEHAAKAAEVMLGKRVVVSACSAAPNVRTVRYPTQGIQF
ncbi:uncharacterized protein MELLADRAFT_110586 [Melampsora larici-populina 98AG31]|uniref:Uncharacterized protein n=1 Tax=Melampsora larici-populina (strain 98AG31 / pathotype 3-4-7) TaxID=747676 RepID=F4S0A4_MELLP|nr:uncharacterized protein MELLADRAFT_110586 [Melampsora larici-populina 98AG31]EGG01973.1 hypothetical protein MELLADRAFT_110586 [Melampsora larici-populina 98AG31]